MGQCAASIPNYKDVYEDTGCVDLSVADCTLDEISKPRNKKFLRRHLPEDLSQTLLHYVVDDCKDFHDENPQGCPPSPPSKKTPFSSPSPHRRELVPAVSSCSFCHDDAPRPRSLVPLEVRLASTLYDIYAFYHHDTGPSSPRTPPLRTPPSPPSPPSAAPPSPPSPFVRAATSPDPSFPALSLSGTLGFETEGPTRERAVTLTDAAGMTRAACVLAVRYGQPAVHVSAPRPHFPHQRPHLRGPSPRYLWAKIQIEGQFPLPVRYSVFLADGDDGFDEEPRFVAQHADVGSPEVQVSGRTGNEKKMRGCCVISLEKACLRLRVSPGTDPALFVCLAIAIEEFMKETLLKLLEKRCKTILQALPL